MKICAKEARRLKSKIEFRRLMEKMKKRCLDFLAQYEVYGYFKKWVVDLEEEFARLGKAFKWKLDYLIGFFCASVDVGRFLYLNNTLQAWDPSTFRGFFGLNFPTKRIFCANSFVAQKSSEMSPLSGSSPVFVSQPLAAQTF